MGLLPIADAIVKSGSLVLPSEIEEQINELETRVDRLRALYEQYFMGIEKMEPQVAKKDVDRRIQSIRREQIRNTALRFRFHMIIQRYNTYQTHWLRICREIEEGTYKRHLLRAGQKFGEAAERLLPKWHRKRTRWSKDGAAEQGVDPAAAAAGAAAAGAGAGAMDFDDVELEEALESVIVRPQPQPPALSKGPPKAPPPLPSRSPGASVPAKPAPVLSAAPREQVAAASAAPHDAASPKPIVSMPANGFAPRPLPLIVPTPANAFRPPGAGPQVVPTPANAFRPGSVAAADGDATKEERMRELARRLNEKKAAAAGGGETTPPRPASPGPAPQVAQRPAPAAPAPAPAAAARPAPAAPPPSSPNPSPRAQRDLSEERMRQLYSELVETKRKQKESTAALTYEGMAKSLRESSAKLKEKHNGRSVDFEVTVKDGKTILRPVVK